MKDPETKNHSEKKPSLFKNILTEENPAWQTALLALLLIAALANMSHYSSKYSEASEDLAQSDAELVLLEAEMKSIEMRSLDLEIQAEQAILEPVFAPEASVIFELQQGVRLHNSRCELTEMSTEGFPEYSCSNARSKVQAGIGGAKVTNL